MYLTSENIENIAVAFSRKYNPDGGIPVPVEEIADFSLGIKIVAVGDLRKTHGIDGCISRDMSSIFIDKNQYMENEYRTRFTIAHELGHYVLHREYIQQLDIKSDQNWKELVISNKKEWSGMEYQAYMFAGYFLMPSDVLKIEYEALLSDRDEEREYFNITRELSKKFQVSDDAVQKRLSYYKR